jgi:response regulator RpfG family c-di-GMP phosphodiesterase
MYDTLYMNVMNIIEYPHGGRLPLAAILIIDDEPGIRMTLASILEDEKYKVFTAEDALIGIETLKQ